MPLARHAVLAVAMLQRAEARVGFDDAAVDPQLASAQKSVRPQRPQQYDVNRIQHIHSESVADDAHAAVIRCRFLQPVAEKTARTQAILTPRRDRAVARQVFEKADHEHFQIHHRIDARPAAARSIRIHRRANRPHLPCEIHPLQRLIHPSEKCRWHCRRHPLRLHPHLSLHFAFGPLFKHAFLDPGPG
jgi:hypothetical protein